MNVLWITNIEFPESNRLISGTGELKSSGGWMLGAAKMLLECGCNIKLTVATVSKKIHTLTKLEGEHITYYLLPYGKGNLFMNSEYEPLWKEVQEKVKPDVVHIHGTEFSHGLAYVKACGKKNVVVSIQGMKSSCYKYYYSGLDSIDFIKNLTFRDIFKGTPIREKKAFKKQGKYEIELLRHVNHIIGRTSWDESKVWAINPNAKYHFCNEILRPEFYEGQKWSYEACDKHSIFLSQATSPIKGMHQLLKAMPLVLSHYPDTRIRIAGLNITHNKGKWGLFHFTSYGKIIKKQILRYNLEDKVFFIGNLNAIEMRDEYLRCNIFVSPSTIENSPNSIGEAQILGTPVIASYVGGVPDMMKGNEENLYRFEEVEMLAYKICRLFNNRDKTKSMIDVANERHNGVKNIKQLLLIYNEIRND